MGVDESREMSKKYPKFFSFFFILSLSLSLSAVGMSSYWIDPASSFYFYFFFSFVNDYYYNFCYRFEPSNFFVISVTLGCIRNFFGTRSVPVKRNRSKNISLRINKSKETNIEEKKRQEKKRNSNNNNNNNNNNNKNNKNPDIYR